MTLKKVSVSVRSLFHQPMDEKIKTWPLCFPAKETLIWRRHCSIGQSCCSMTSKKFLESSSGMKFVYPRVRLANQNPGAFVSVSYTNQIALFPFVCCFCFVRAFSFQGHTKIALIIKIQQLESRAYMDGMPSYTHHNIQFSLTLIFVTLQSILSTPLPTL